MMVMYFTAVALRYLNQINIHGPCALSVLSLLWFGGEDEGLKLPTSAFCLKSHKHCRSLHQTSASRYIFFYFYFLPHAHAALFILEPILPSSSIIKHAIYEATLQQKVQVEEQEDILL